MHAELWDSVDHLDLNNLEVSVSEVPDLVHLAIQCRVCREVVIAVSFSLLDLLNPCSQERGLPRFAIFLCLCLQRDLGLRLPQYCRPGIRARCTTTRDMLQLEK